MIEFVVIFLVVLAGCGVLFTVLLFLPKAFPFFVDWVSRLSSSFADWLASTKGQEAELARASRCKERLERDRCRRERNHLLWRWDFKWLLASVCILLFGLFLLWVGDSGQSFLKQALDEHQYYPVKWAGHVFWSYEEWKSEFDNFGSVVMTGVRIAFFLCLVFSFLAFCFVGVIFLRRLAIGASWIGRRI